MKKFFLAIVASVVVSSVSAQDKKFWFGGEVGVGVTSAKILFGSKSNLNPGFSFNFSGRVDYQISSRLGLTSGIGYQRLSLSQNYIYDRYPDGTLAITEFGVELNYDIIRIPIVAVYRPINRFNMELGFINQFIVHEKVAGDGKEIFLSDYGSTKTYLPSLEVAFGYDLVSNDNVRLSLNIFAEYSANVISEDTYKFRYYGLRTAVMF